MVSIFETLLTFIFIYNMHDKGAVNFEERFADAVGFSSSEEYTVGTIWFGTPLQKPSRPPKKMRLDDVLKRVE